MGEDEVGRDEEDAVVEIENGGFEVVGGKAVKAFVHQQCSSNPIHPNSSALNARDCANFNNSIFKLVYALEVQNVDEKQNKL